MIKRKKYLKDIRGFYNDTSLIKIIYGLRRSGKSVILTQIIKELKEKKVAEDHIIYIDFELLTYSAIRTAKDLDDYVLSYTKDKGIYYVFCDEIQRIEDFELGINSLRARGNYSVFITGSNSRMTFMELSTDLSGRYVSFKINPLSFKEIVALTKTKEDEYNKLIHDIFEWGSLPHRFFYKDDTDGRMKINYIQDVYNSIILRDIIERLGLRDTTTFNKILQYLIEIEGREFSAENIQEFMKIEHKEISTETLYIYLDALCSKFILNKVYRYDIEGKKILKTLNKYYSSDLGIRNIKNSKKELNYTVCLENLVYNELIQKGYEVYIGKTKKGEVDFVASKNKEVKYIQVCYRLSDSEDTILREFGAYEFISDNYPKYVISLDRDNYSRNGIKHVNAIDFFLDDNF